MGGAARAEAPKVELGSSAVVDPVPSSNVGPMEIWSRLWMEEILHKLVITAVKARVIPVISTKKIPFIECIIP